ncbi:MAG: deoxyguanosinetriphosphate triphosphohydrolase [Acidobacteria bacterium]|nr:MAG: deoxyguanosinetriphosphate triphosphohydrolase [Acidobacteriota bacterium]
MREGNEPGLASYGMSVSKSLGRRFPERPHPYRNEYERDRDRIIHSRAFRRLENKTQVFTRRYSDHFRNRLTHTLEVAQISRTVAKALHLNTDLVEALALVHDVGHPPFGHAGETELDRLMGQQGDRFDHNLHALRIVEQFEQKYVDFPGLNLTFEVREGIIKHSRDYNVEQYPYLKEYRLDERPLIEAQLIDVADEIAYNCADLDDGYEAKLLTLDQIREGVPLFGRLLRPVERKHPEAMEKLKFNEALKGLMDSLVTDLIEATRERLERMRVRTVEDVRAAPSRMVGFSPRISRGSQGLKAFLRDNLYTHREIYAERKRIVRSVAQMFEFYMEHPRRLPPFYFGKTKQEPTYRVVCDYIAGMTDNYLAELHRKYVES